MKQVRAFIAIEIPAGLQQKLKMLTSPLSRIDGSPVRWVRSENIHLTLKFYGEAEIELLKTLAERLQSELAGQAPFDLEVSGFGAFPNLNRPRVFWCGMKSSSGLGRMQKTVETASSVLGFEPENRPFSPHLTLGRASDHAAPRALDEVAAAFRGFPSDPLGVTQVTGLVIFRSQLNAGGSIYTPLFQIPFSGLKTSETGS